MLTSGRGSTPQISAGEGAISSWAGSALTVHNRSTGILNSENMMGRHLESVMEIGGF